MSLIHPQPDEHGQPVTIKRPSKASPLKAWNNPDAVATAVPAGPMPLALNGIAFASWEAPVDPTGWQAEVGAIELDEPPFDPPAGRRHRSAGTLTKEVDGRIWLAVPTNGFANYRITPPKGRIEPGYGLHETAIRETFEETGLRVRLRGFLADTLRTTSYNRFYLAERIGGTPADMGWESQAVHLVPHALLGQYLTHPNDQPLLQALQAHTG